MEARRSTSAAARRLRRLVALSTGYLKYLFMRRGRLLRKVARRTLALLSHHHKSRSKGMGAYSWPCALEYEFSCSNSPSPAFFSANTAAAAVSSCFGLRAPCGSAATTSEEVVVVEDEDVWVMSTGEFDVDNRAEEFINMFYEQLREQSFAAVFQSP